MKKRNPKLLGIAWAIILLVVVTGMITASFLLTAYIYKNTILNPPALVVQIVNSLVGLVLTGLMIGCGSAFARSKGWAPEMNLFGPIIEAMQKIAKGDFTIRLDDNYHGNEPVSALVQSVNNMAVELKQMEEMRQEFISNVSHEIQSPLTSIRGFARALQNDALRSEDRNHYLNIIETESMRLSKLSDNLLALASLESENPRFEPKPFRLDRQIRSLILACEPQWTNKAIDMNVAVEQVTITADEVLLSQVWINLIHNSIKFTPPGGSVCVDLQSHDGHVEFKIADTGIGIDAEDQAHIFERFFKADKSRDRSKGGSGLGLSIAQKIVEMHHGTIAVESELGAGTTFMLCLPVEH
jgi:two-component system, OmpR family, phosphate regulon sensor histidine kinase PhoR